MKIIHVCRDYIPCRFADLKLSLELYSLDPNLKLHPPRAKRENSQHTFSSSNYRLIMKELDKKDKMSNWIVVRAVEELIKIHAPENWARSFVKELDQASEHESFDTGDFAATAQYLCKSDCGWS